MKVEPEDALVARVRGANVQPGVWFTVGRYAGAFGHRMQRAIERGDITLPGGNADYELQVTVEPDGEGTVLWAKRSN